MTKRNKIIYWIATLWLALGMVSTGIVQLLNVKEEVDRMTHLGYPVYFLSILGVWKILGVIALLMPKFPLIKEWTYAGFFFFDVGCVAFTRSRRSNSQRLLWASIAADSDSCILVFQTSGEKTYAD